jgi:AmiR/NasT family two-component response regulator
VHAFPLRLRGEIIGALGVFSAETDSIDATLTPIVQALADVATIALLQERTIARGELLTEQLQAALNSRIIIEQAKGVLAYIHSVSVDEAFVLLRNHVRRHNLRLTETARAIATDPGNAPDLIGI